MFTKQIKMTDGIMVELTYFEPEGKPKGVIQMIHGFGEHSGRYIELAERFVEHSYIFLIHDQRGHGKTEGKRGVTPSYQHLLHDIDTVRDYIQKQYKGLPVVLYGHSMGGNLTANYLLLISQERYQCAIIGSPWLKLHKSFPTVVFLLASWLGKISPNLTIQNKLELSVLTHDSKMLEAARKDEMYHNYISFLLFTQITKHGEYAIAHSGGIKIPTLLMYGDEDTLVSVPAIKAFAENTGKEVIVKDYPELYHELHNETERAVIFDDVLEFIEKHLERN